MSGGSVAVFVPATREQARRLAAGHSWSAPAFAATPELRDAHDVGPAEAEEAGYVALGYAGLAALLTTPALRLVLAADVDEAQVGQDETVDPAYGRVRVTGLRWGQVQALFADESGAGADLDAARGLAAGRSLDQVADDEGILELVDRRDLLWFAPSELDTLPTS